MPVKFPLRLTSCIISTHPIEMLVACLFCPQCLCCLFFLGTSLTLISGQKYPLPEGVGERCYSMQILNSCVLWVCPAYPHSYLNVNIVRVWLRVAAQLCLRVWLFCLRVFFPFYCFVYLFFVFCYCCTQLEREHLQRVFKGHCVVKVGCEMLFCQKSSCAAALLALYLYTNLKQKPNCRSGFHCVSACLILPFVTNCSFRQRKKAR